MIDSILGRLISFTHSSLECLNVYPQISNQKNKFTQTHKKWNPSIEVINIFDKQK